MEWMGSWVLVDNRGTLKVLYVVQRRQSRPQCTFRCSLNKGLLLIDLGPRLVSGVMELMVRVEWVRVRVKGWGLGLWWKGNDI
ncbi:unnamed protein product [Prunus armeniaca]|uniref:Uncharacterized protein n=1 Tax=Prunus armeniaca TaxID=36596 RepID=A0A6J5V9S9_PRUAR|nr:unnamed protein product [Prunus armeniaca]